MIHLLPLPGAASSGRSMAAVVEDALDRASVLRHGSEAVMVDNFGDAPFVATK